VTGTATGRLRDLLRNQRTTSAPSLEDPHDVNLGRWSSAALMASGLAGVVTPSSVASALELPAATPRGIAETRAGLGGTYAALGGWALVSRDPTAQAAVGVVWLGAASARVGSLLLDRPRTDRAFWAYLAAEIGFGTAALVGARRPRLGDPEAIGPEWLAGP
jgi:hypothetical protein